MVDTCVCCGEIIPEDSHYCRRCANDGNGVKCPQCGSSLKVMHSGFNITDTDITWETLFHCEDCGSDWEKQAKYLGQPVEFKRKFWG